MIDVINMQSKYQMIRNVFLTLTSYQSELIISGHGHWHQLYTVCTSDAKYKDHGG